MSNAPTLTVNTRGARRSISRPGARFPVGTRLPVSAALLALLACADAADVLEPLVRSNDPAVPSTASIAPTLTFLELDGVDDYVHIAPASAFDLVNGSYTIEAWIHPYSWGESSQGRIVDHGGGSPVGGGWTFHVQDKASLVLQVNNSGLNFNSRDYALELERWQHVAVSVSGGVARFYVDGAEQGIASDVPAPNPTTVPIRIGRRATDSGRSFHGFVDEVRIWNRALSQAEIQAGMQTDPPSRSGLIAYYALNEGSGGSANDGSGNGYHGQLLGGPIWHGAVQPPPPQQSVLTRIVVSPAAASIPVSTTLQYSATGYDQYGQTMPIAPQWRATAGSIGSSGLYSAPTVAGQHTVSASSGSVTGSAQVKVVSVVVPEDPETPTTSLSHLQLHGHGDYVEIADAPALDLTDGSYTIEAWIHPHSWGENSQARIVDHGGGSLPAGWAFQVIDHSDAPASLMLQVNNSGLQFRSTPNVLALSRWQHVAVAVTAGVARFYVDGIARGLVTGVPTPAPADVPVRIGTRATDLERWFVGSFDEVRIWNRALSEVEIRAGMAVEPGPGNGLLAEYDFNEGSGSTAYDDSGRGFHGQLFGNPTWHSGNAAGTLPPPPPPQPERVLTSVVVAPAEATLTAGSTLHFTAAGFDQLGQPMAITPQWSTTRGSIDGFGNYTAPSAAGQYTISATYGGVTGRAVVTVVVPEEPPPPPPSPSARAYLELDGVDDYVEIPTAPALGLTDGSFTIEAWIHPHSWGENGQGRIIDHGGGSPIRAGWTFQLVHNNLARGSLMLQVNNSGLNFRSIENAVALDRWQHVAVSVSNDVARFYVNGVEQGVATGVPMPEPTDVPVRIGRRATDTERAFDGLIDEVHVWARARSQQEIQAGMSTDPAPGSGLVAEYDLNDASGFIAYDDSGNGFHGQLYGNPTWHAGDAGSGGGGGGTDPPPAPVLTSLKVSPRSASLQLGSTQQYSAAALDQFGQPMSVTVQWSVTGGTISASGLYTAFTAGQFTVSARAGTVVGDASVDVVDATEPPPPPPPEGSARITGVSFDWSTHKRAAPGSDNWPITWSDDGHQYTSWGDGGGFEGTNTTGRVSLGVARVAGSSGSYSGVNRYGGVRAECPASIKGKSYGILSLKGTLYMWVSPGSGEVGFDHFTLYKSTDKGCTWTRLNVTFTLAEHQLANGVFLNFGQDYAGARDGFVYAYAAGIQNALDLVIQKPGAIYLMRVPIAGIENQSEYEFYSGTDPSNPTWSRNPTNRRPVFRDLAGVSWNTGSVNFVPGLNRYVLTTEHTRSSDGNIQMHEAPEPWGPWTQILRESAWGPVAASTFYWTIAPKWYRNGGVNFTLVFSGGNSNDSWNTVEGTFVTGGP